MLIGEYLIKQPGTLTREQLKIALEEQAVLGGNEKLGEILIRLGFVRRSVIIDALSQLNPSALVGDTNAGTAFPLDYLKETRTVVLGDSGQYVFIATLHPTPQEVVNHLKAVTGRNVQLYNTEQDKIMEGLAKVHGSEFAAEFSPNLSTDENINRVLNTIIEDAIRSRASDLHLELREKTLQIRVRIDGMLHLAHTLSLSQAQRLMARIKDLSGIDVSQKREPQDGSFSTVFNGQNIDFRVATIPAAHGEKITIRVLNKEENLKALHELGITKLDEWKALAENKNGLILVCGATGSGKTTTLYSTIQYCDRLHKSVYSIEDPIEYRLPWVTQVQVNHATGFSFARFTKTVLRHDPDVVIVGETRDEETAANAIYLADTGHLVFTTLHTGDVASSINRLLGMKVDKQHLSFVLRGVMVQRLARKICPTCRKEGCSDCRETGYKGMTLLTEFARIQSPKDIDRIMAGDFPVHTFAMDAQEKVRQGLTDCDELRRVLGDKSVMICDSNGCLRGRETQCM